MDHGQTLIVHDQIIRDHSQRLAELSARVDAIADGQSYIRDRMDQKSKDDQRRHEELMEAVTSNRIASSIIQSKWKMAGAIVVAGISIVFGAIGAVFTILKTFFTA